MIGKIETRDNKKRIRMSLRLYFSLASITTLCFSCLIACTIVLTAMKLFYHGGFTVTIVVISCLLVCALTMAIGAVVLWFGTNHLIRPITEVTAAIKKVSEGDFTTKIGRNQRLRGEYQYSNELDEMAENFNKMTAELKGMDYMRKDFMSNVSHEVKTPVAAIMGLAEILQDGGLSEEEQVEYLDLIYSESVRLSNLCENMLRLSRLDNQAIVEKKDKFALDEQLRKCIILLAEKWCDENHEFELNLDKCSIVSNYDLLFQVWTNLIDNAIKYSDPESRIWVALEDEDNSVIVTVKDEGKGISEEKLHRIFEKFYQCEESHKKQGNGLGLSIVKRILELLDGNISCESREEKGTTMVVTIRK